MANYDLRFGPLAFVAAADEISETLGDALEAVGAILTPTERRPRPMKLSLPVRGARQEPNVKAAGYLLRQQVRELLENPRWRRAGLFFRFEADPDLDCWVLVGGGELAETNLGVTFGEWKLDLTDLYVVARPSTHRPARRFEMADRRNGLVARDTRGRLYSTDHAAVALPTHPLVLPGDATAVRLARGRAPASYEEGPTRAGRRLYRRVPAVAGDAASYLPGSAVAAAGGHPYADLDAPGSVRAWGLEVAVTIAPAQFTVAGDADPTLYGWRRAYGPARAAADTGLALDNGLCRVIFPSSTTASAYLEWYEPASGRYRREATISGANGVTDKRVVELTPERGVLEFRGPSRVWRVILERGWHGPRIEAYHDDGGTARLELAPLAGAPAVVATSVAHVDALDTVVTNGVRNPGLRTNATDWSHSGGTLTSFTRVSDTASPTGFAADRVGQPTAGGSVQIFVDGAAGGSPVAPGETVLARIFARLRSTDAGVTVRPFVRWLTAAGALVSDSYPIPAVGQTNDGAYRELVGRGVAPAGSAVALVGAEWQGLDVGQSRNLRAAGAQVIRNPPDTDPGYFDGALPGAAGTYAHPFSRWTGAADASTSELVHRIRWVKGTDADERTTYTSSGSFISGPGVAYTRTGVVVAQLGLPGVTAVETTERLAGLALVDARSIPALVER